MKKTRLTHPFFYWRSYCGLKYGNLKCHGIVWFYYRPQTKFAKVVFSQVSVCPHGGLSATHLPWADTLPVHAGIDTPYIMHAGIHPTPILRDTVNKRAVCIPLECILVMFVIVNVNRPVNHPQLTLLIILQQNSNQCELYQKVLKLIPKL